MRRNRKAADCIDALGLGRNRNPEGFFGNRNPRPLHHILESESDQARNLVFFGGIGVGHKFLELVPHASGPNADNESSLQNRN